MRIGKQNKLDFSSRLNGTPRQLAIEVKRLNLSDGDVLEVIIPDEADDAVVESFVNQLGGELQEKGISVIAHRPDMDLVCIHGHAVPRLEQLIQCSREIVTGLCLSNRASTGEELEIAGRKLVGLFSKLEKQLAVAASGPVDLDLESCDEDPALEKEAYDSAMALTRILVGTRWRGKVYREEGQSGSWVVEVPEAIRGVGSTPATALAEFLGFLRER